MRRSVALPHMVDAAGISCSYKDGLLRIQVPIMPPILSHDDDHALRVDKLQQELKDAEELVSEFESKLAEHKAKAAAAREALRSEKRASTEAHILQPGFVAEISVALQLSLARCRE